MHEILVRLIVKSKGGPGDVYDAVNHALDTGVLQDAINDHDATAWDMRVESATVEWPKAV